MTVTLCEKVCKNCPFQKQNSHHLNLPEIRNMIDNNIVSPCHMDMVKYTGVENSGVEYYAQVAPEFRVCRGMVEARILADLIPKDNALWAYLEGQFYADEPHGDIVDLKELL